MTQEQLAEVLSISPQAVSRWETNAAMPDISLLAPLCNLFSITSDELLGIDITRRQEKVVDLRNKADKYSSRGYLDEAYKILEDGLRKYPDHCDIMKDLMYVSSWSYNKTKDRKYLDNAIQLGEKILAQSTEDHQRHAAIQILCFSYCDAGRLDEAVKMAETMPFMCLSRELLLSEVYLGSKKYSAKQIEAINLLQFLSNELGFLQTKLDSGEYAYTADECAVICDKRIALLHLFFENGDFGFYHTHLCDAHIDQSLYYAGKNENDKALTHLRLAAKHAIKFITSCGDEKYTSLVFRGMDRGSWGTDSSKNNVGRLLEIMGNKVFDQIRSTEEFVNINNELAEYAVEWKVGE